MRRCIASRIVRITFDIDDPTLADLKRLQRREGKSLGRLVSDHLAQSLAAPHAAARKLPALKWITQPMGARIDLSDREALLRAMDEPLR